METVLCVQASCCSSAELFEGSGAKANDWVPYTTVVMTRPTQPMFNAGWEMLQGRKSLQVGIIHENAISHLLDLRGMISTQSSVSFLLLHVTVPQ